MKMKLYYALIAIALIQNNTLSAQLPPVIPVGLDAYRMWDQWPNQRIGVRAYMRSTYDRSGGNESADASHYLFMGEDERNNVTLDVAGKGVLYFVRTNHWHGSPWYYTVDGTKYTVKETATADPVNAKKQLTNTSFIPETAFPTPLALTWNTTKGADLMCVPIGFKDSFQLAYGRTRYGTGYYIWHQYANDEYLSQPVRSWNIDQRPDQDVLDLINLAGTDIAPKNIKSISGTKKLNEDKVELAYIHSSSSAIRALKLTLPLKDALDLERLRLQITWDDRSKPSVDAPLCLFFGAGTFYNRDEKEYLVKGFPINVRFDYENRRVELACYYPMPFFKSARITLTGITSKGKNIDYEVRYEPYKLEASQSGYFHATYKDILNAKAGKDLVLLDTRGIEGHEEWSGNFVGTSFIFTQNNNLHSLEGDPRFFFDDSRTPQAYGTGTEEWGGGGGYWNRGQTMTLPFVGHPVGGVEHGALNKKDSIHSAYRFLLADLMPFGNHAVICLEHGRENLSTEHYETVTYWYGIPAPALIKTDEIDVGNKRSERVHKYRSPDASKIYTVTSRYELGIDSFPRSPIQVDLSKVPDYKPGAEVYPAHSENGRYTRRSSEFNIRLSANNHGALIRRTLDYSFPNQKAEVYVTGNDKKNWRYVGIWYLAGSNTCVYSDPKSGEGQGELARRVYHVQTSDRQFRDDEFMIPEKFTKGHHAMRIRVKFIPGNKELYPGMPFPKQGSWSELRYDVYSYVMPRFSVE